MKALNSSNIGLTVLAAFSLLAATVAVRAQPGQPGSARHRPVGAAPAATAPVASSDLDDKIIPELSFQNIALEDMVAFLQDTVPHFKAVVLRDPDVGPDLPMINIRLKSVSLGQLMQLLSSAYPYIEFQPITGAGGTIQLIKVHSPQGIAPNGGAIVKVYALADVVDRLAMRRPEAGKDAAGARKAALNDVLSLIKATLSQSSDGSAAPTLQLHEETQTLIFKGGQMQQVAVEDVLASLTPKANEQSEREVEIARSKAEYQARIAQMDERAQELHKRLAEMTDALRQREEITNKQSMELERLKVRLEEMTKMQDREAERSKGQPAGK